MYRIYNQWWYLKESTKKSPWITLVQTSTKLWPAWSTHQPKSNSSHLANEEQMPTVIIHGNRKCAKLKMECIIVNYCSFVRSATRTHSFIFKYFELYLDVIPFCRNVNSQNHTLEERKCYDTFLAQTESGSQARHQF